MYCNCSEQALSSSVHWICIFITNNDPTVLRTSYNFYSNDSKHAWSNLAQVIQFWWFSVWIRFHEIKPYLPRETLVSTIFQRKSKKFETKNWTGLKTSKLLCIQYVWQNFSCLNLLQYMIYHSWNLWTDLSEHMPAQIISYILLSYII